MKITQTFQPETLVVVRDGQIDDEYYDMIYEERRRAAIQAAGREVIEIMTRPARNLALNLFDLVRESAQKQ